MGDQSAGPYGIKHHSHAHQALHVMVLSPPQEELQAQEVGTFIDHEAATVHPAGLTSTHVVGNVRAVAHTLIGAALEVPLLIEDYLKQNSDEIDVTIQ